MQPRYDGDMDMVAVVDAEGKKFEFGIYRRQNQQDFLMDKTQVVREGD